jgi:hypothetical protein
MAAIAVIARRPTAAATKMLVRLDRPKALYRRTPTTLAVRITMATGTPMTTAAARYRRRMRPLTTI